MVLLSSAPVLLMSVALMAQAPGGAQPSMPQQQAPSAQTQPMPSSADNSGASSAQSFADQSFVTKAMEGGDAEVELGQLAEQKSQSNDVKQFAQKMVNDHGQMGEKWFKPVAKKLNVSEPKGPSKKDKKLIEKLQGLSGAEFDTEYIQAMVKDHKDDLKEFKSEAQVAQDPMLKEIAEKGATVIQQHLQLIEQIAQAHNVPVDGKAGEMSSK